MEVFIMANETDSHHNSSVLMCMSCLVEDNENAGSVRWKTAQTEWETAAVCTLTLVTVIAYCWRKETKKKITAKTDNVAILLLLSCFSTHRVLDTWLSNRQQMKTNIANWVELMHTVGWHPGLSLSLRFTMEMQPSTEPNRRFLLQTNIIWQP